MVSHALIHFFTVKVLGAVEHNVMGFYLPMSLGDNPNVTKNKTIFICATIEFSYWLIVLL
jgi:hypothetical protein